MRGLVIKYIFFFSLLLLVVLPWAKAQETDNSIEFSKTRICNEQTVEERNEAFLEALSLKPLWNKLASVGTYMKYVHFENATAIKEELNKERELFVESEIALKKFQELTSKLYQGSPDNKIIDLLATYQNEYRIGSETIDYIVIDYENSLRLEKRVEFRAALISGLNAKFRAFVNKAIDEDLSLSHEEKDFLNLWTFKLIPLKPDYQWTESANLFHRYLWDSFYDSKVFNGPTGKYNGNTYWLETIVNSDFPGLSLNLALRSKGNSLVDSDLNIKFILSPYIPHNQSIEICDLNSITNENSCENISLESWCTN